MSKKSVAILFGGKSATHDDSIESAASIISHMSDEKYLTIPIYVTRDGAWLLYDGPLSNFKTVSFEKFGSKAVISPDTEHKGLLRIVNERVKNIPLDAVIPLIPGTQGLLELAEIPYTGCSAFSSELCLDREYVRKIVTESGLEQADYFEFCDEDLTDMAQVTKKIRYKLGYPVIVRPTGEKAENKKELEDAIERASQDSPKVIVEKESSGQIIKCLVLGDETFTEGSLPDYTGDITEDMAGLILEKASDIFKATQCCGLIQISFILREDNNLLFNEIETIPDYATISGYSVYKNDVLIDKLIDMALKRRSK